jgi:iron-sulfur cluster repair protein YtfE (RIC family)
MARLVVFGVLLAMLSVGRVALSFAVVQKNLQTDAVATRYRTVAAQNQQLGETAASLSSALTIRNTAINRYHLIVSSNVQFVTVRPVHAGKHASH